MAWLQRQDGEGVRHAGRSIVVAAAILLAGTAVAGCSDDDDGAAGTATAEGATETEGTGDTDTGATSADEQVMIEIVDISTAYEPSTASVATGGDATWVNGDDIPHTVTAEDDTFDSGNLEPGAEFTFAPDEPGTYPYVCTIHPGMAGELIVE